MDAIYIINLACDENRRRRMSRIIEQYDLKKLTSNIIFFDAVDKRGSRPPPTFRGPAGAYGCTLSHIMVLQDAQARSFERVLVCEDDLIMLKTFWDNWQILQTTAPPDSTILYLGATQTSWAGISLAETIPCWYRARNTLGTTAYIVNGKSAMQDIYQGWLNNPSLPIDEYLMRFQQTNECHVAYPNLCIQSVDNSHIRDAQNKWTLESVSKALRWDLSLYDLTCSV